MQQILIVLFTITSIGVIGLSAWLLKKIYFSKEEDTNSDIYFLISSDYTEGYAMGVKREEDSAQNMVKITLLPRDINPLVNDLSKIPSSITLFTERNRIIPLFSSKHRNIYLVIPHSTNEVPPQLKKHPFGRYIMEYIKDCESEEDKEYLQDKREKNLLKVAGKVHGFDLIADLEEYRKEYLGDLIDSTHHGGEKKKKRKEEE